MRDGVHLSADAYLPKAEEPAPVVLSRTPYNKNTERTYRLMAAFAEHGYAAVSMDVRGRGDSEGEFEPYRHDGEDGFDAIEWIAEQPWCTGAVATLGGSYPGLIQWLTALLRPPHLRAMIVLVCPSDPFVEWPTGTPGPMSVCWHRMTHGRVVQFVEPLDWADIYRHLPLMTMDERAGFDSANWREVLSHPTLDDYWEPLRYQDRIGELDLPVLHVSGWYDDEEIGTPLNFTRMIARAPDDPAAHRQRLLMGPWGHGVNSQRQIGDVDFGPDALVDLEGIERRFLDRWLKDERNGLEDEPPVRIFVMGTNEWRDEATWPLERTEWRTLHLRSGGNANSRLGDGRLGPKAPTGQEPSDVYTSDPSNPVPFLTDPLSNQIGGPDDYRAVEQRGDVLVYVTEPLQADVEITGPVRLVLSASSSAVDTDFMAKLVDVHPGGFVQRLCDGMVRARFRQGMDREVPLDPGAIERYEIALWDTSQVFRAGHRIGLEIASSAFPKYDRNLQTGEPLATGTRMELAENRVFHDAEHRSHLILPVIPTT